jgi:hypothetical protein
MTRSRTAGGRDAGIAIGIAVFGLAVLFLTPVAGVPTRGTVAAAWAATAAIVVAALWVPTRRWAAWPAEDRRASLRSVAFTLPLAAGVAALALILGVAVAVLLNAADAGLFPHLWRALGDGNGWLFVAVAVVALTYAMRPVTPLGAVVWGQRKGLEASSLPPLTAELRRLRTWRTLPAVLGAAIGIGPGVAYNLWHAVHGLPSDAAAQRLMETSMRWPYDPITLALVGYLLGAIVAETTRRRPVAAVGAHEARLDTRTPAQYLTRPARWIPTVLAALTVVSLLLARAGGSQESLWPGAVAAVVAGLAAGVQRWVVRRPQRLTTTDGVAVDDVLRSSAAHAVTGGAGALLLILAGGASQVALAAWNLDSGFAGGVVGVLVGVGLSAGVVGLWLGYGSAHRGVARERRFAEPVA